MDVIVGAAVVLFGGYVAWWLCSPGMRARIEQPKHAFLHQACERDPVSADVHGEQR